MHHKAIKAQIRKQLKIRYLNWHRLTKKEKKAVAKNLLNEVIANYDFKQEVTTPEEELLGIDTQLPTNVNNEELTAGTYIFTCYLQDGEVREFNTGVLGHTEDLLTSNQGYAGEVT